VKRTLKRELKVLEIVEMEAIGFGGRSECTQQSSSGSGVGLGLRRLPEEGCALVFSAGQHQFGGADGARVEGYNRQVRPAVASYTRECFAPLD